MITKTDVDKRAYLPSPEQQNILRLAGIEPLEGGDQHAPGYEGRWTSGGPSGRYSMPVRFSYYDALRNPDRIPEPRMGRDIIDRLEVGKYLYMGWDGHHVLFSMHDSA
ncbi:hypothetical protein BH688_10365 [Kushneria phosphatilytica]|nr:hypothetical protein BH688_10365 [Kushneria phosphatilytica]